MGAWIETLTWSASKVTSLSHPMWVRGLKQTLKKLFVDGGVVASYVGAWIETLASKLKPLSVKSHPMWVRGLKQYCDK